MVSLLQHEMTAHVRFGSWPCKNSNAHCARSNILEKLRVLRIDDSSDTRMDAVLENCIFYSFPMYEFSHRQTLSSSSVENLPLIKDQRVTTDAVNAVNFLDAR